MKAINGAAALAAAEPVIQLRPSQVAVLTALDRAMLQLQTEAGMLAEFWGERAAAGEIAGAVEFIGKLKSRYFADAQRTILVPEVKVVLK